MDFNQSNNEYAEQPPFSLMSAIMDFIAQQINLFKKARSISWIVFIVILVTQDQRFVRYLKDDR